MAIPGIGSHRVRGGFSVPYFGLLITMYMYSWKTVKPLPLEQIGITPPSLGSGGGSSAMFKTSSPSFYPMQWKHPTLFLGRLWLEQQLKHGGSTYWKSMDRGEVRYLVQSWKVTWAKPGIHRQFLRCHISGSAGQSDNQYQYVCQYTEQIILTLKLGWEAERTKRIAKEWS